MLPTSARAEAGAAPSKVCLPHALPVATTAIVRDPTKACLANARADMMLE